MRYIDTERDKDERRRERFESEVTEPFVPLSREEVAALHMTPKQKRRAAKLNGATLRKMSSWR